MSTVNLQTVGESLYWSYANLAMAFASARHDKPTYQQVDYIVRNKLYNGLLRGELQLGSFLKDEKEKVASSGVCCYCGSTTDLTLDHLIAQLKGGEHSADNLVQACRSCKSSKQALDLLEWMAKRKVFPPLRLLRRYLKIAIRYCLKHDLMDFPLEHATGNQPLLPFATEQRDPPRLPFTIGLIPHTFPDPSELWEEWEAVDPETEAETLLSDPAPSVDEQIPNLSDLP